MPCHTRLEQPAVRGLQASESGAADHLVEQTQSGDGALGREFHRHAAGGKRSFRSPGAQPFNENSPLRTPQEFCVRSSEPTLSGPANGAGHMARIRLRFQAAMILTTVVAPSVVPADRRGPRRNELGPAARK